MVYNVDHLVEQIAIFGCGLAVMAYVPMADRFGWPTGSAIRSGSSWVNAIGIVAMIASIALSGGMMGPLAFVITTAIVIVAGFFVGMVLTYTARALTQIIAPVGAVVAFLAWIFVR